VSLEPAAAAGPSGPRDPRAASPGREAAAPDPRSGGAGGRVGLAAPRSVDGGRRFRRRGRRPRPDGKP